MKHPDRIAELVAAGLAEPDRVFSAPWEARAFAIALGLVERGLCDWEDFRARLIGEISAADRARAGRGPAGDDAYFEHFLRALERLCAEKRIIIPAELSQKLRES
jgi:nitrile hydratase accessory protein